MTKKVNVNIHQESQVTEYDKVVKERGNIACDYCFSNLKKEWEDYLLAAIKENSKSKFIQILVASNSAIMLEEGKEKNEIIKYISSEIHNFVDLCAVLSLLLHYFPKGKDFVNSFQHASEKIPDLIMESYEDEIKERKKEEDLVLKAQEAFVTLVTFCDSEKMQDYARIVGTNIETLANRLDHTLGFSVFLKEEESRLRSYAVMRDIIMMVYDHKSPEEIQEKISSLELDDETIEFVCSDMVEYFHDGVSTRLIREICGSEIPKQFNRGKIEEKKKVKAKTSSKKKNNPIADQDN